MHVGRSCSIKVNHDKNVTAQVVGFNGNTALLMPYDTMEGIRSGASVIPQGGTETLPVGDALLGRVVDANLNPIDNGPTLPVKMKKPPYKAVSRPLWNARESINLS